MLVRWAAPVAVIALFAACQSNNAGDAPTPRTNSEPHQFQSYDGRSVAAELGRLVVPADRDEPNTRSVTLAYVRLPATSAMPGAPIVFLAGGPGIPGGAIGRVPPYASLFLRLRECADVILLDQRGTGQSEPGLQCASARLPVDAFAAPAALADALAQRAGACAAELRARGIEPSDFNARESADDLEDLRRALGAEQLDLVAWSYGGEVALDALRRHPRLFGRVVLAGARGPDLLLKSPAVWDAQLRALSELAARDANAAALTQDLYSSTQHAFSALDAAPVTLDVIDHATGAPVLIRAGKIALQTLVRFDLSDARAAARLPALVGSVERGDHTLLRLRLEQLYNSFNVSGALATDCASGWSAARRAVAEREAADAVLSNVNAQWAPEICAALGVEDLGRAYRRPVASDVRALFISGSLDPTRRHRKQRRCAAASVPQRMWCLRTRATRRCRSTRCKR
jgi:pimeloyl-ACP methyl ester carboxylesterase